MISSVKIKGSKGSVLQKCWGEREFKFTEGINIIFGENGCGKTVLMDTIALYTGVDKRGWSTGLTPSRIDYHTRREKDKSYYPDIISKSSKLGLIDIDWDGMPCYKSDTQRDSFSMLSNLMGGGAPEEISLEEALKLKFSNLSAGQGVQHFLLKLLKLKVPDLTIPISQHFNDTWASMGKILSNYVVTLPRNGKPTILLDEPDKSLDFVSQSIMWGNLLNQLVPKYQIIVITHSPFALHRDDCNIIDKDNYFSVSKELIKTTFGN